MKTEHPSVCPLDCPDTCSLTVTVEDDRIVSIRGSRANPYTAGVLCAKVPEAYPGFVHGEGRLTAPLRRVGAKGQGRFERVSWAQALDLKVSNLKPDHLDPDLLDERVRATLNYVAPGETVIMQPTTSR